MKKTVILVILVAFAGVVALAQTSPKSTQALSSPRIAAVAPTLSLSASVQPPIRHLVRINQLDVQQYRSSQEYTTWAYSACSTAAMAEVVNFYSNNSRFRITDILQAEIQAHAITPELGLLDRNGIVRTLSTPPFHFHTDISGHSLDQIIALANGGSPAIVSFWSSQLYPGGHVLTVIGGDTKSVRVADSSRLNIPVFSRSRFLQLWTGYVAIVTPTKKGVAA